MDRVGYLPEERGLYKKMQVRRVLLFLAELKGINPTEATRRIDEWLDRFSLRTPEKDWGEAKVDELSRGMQQKVQFIATLLHDPDLVILDEPFSGLDPINAQALKDAVARAEAPRQDRHLQHARDGQRREDVRLGVHHRSRREGARRPRHRRQASARVRGTSRYRSSAVCRLACNEVLREPQSRP